MEPRPTGKTVRQIHPDEAYLLREALESETKGEHSRALELIEKVLASDPHHAIAWHEKGNSLDELGRCEEALSCYDRAISLDAQNAETWFNKGLTLKKMGREKEAYDCMNRGVELALGR
ncbi:MAG: tetratricopeptide repeat protein [Methanolinea sp.]|nr:tetratricopeptide repeat protein [Methanolinea sp.]